jgi:predicted transcriptional regulator
MKTIQIEDELHKKLKDFSDKSGMKVKAIVENALDWYLRHVQVIVE